MRPADSNGLAQRRYDAGTRTRPEPGPSWSEIAGGLGSAFGGLVLALQAAVLLPGMLPFAALTVVALLPFVVLGAVLALPVALSLAVWRAFAWALRHR